MGSNRQSSARRGRTTGSRGRLALALTGAVAIALALVGGTARVSRRAGQEAADEAAGSARRGVEFPAPAPLPRFPLAETPEEAVKEVASALNSWRNGILQRDPDTVVKLDMTFREAPDRYAGALADSAATDSDARVRAFSTRMLGKLHRADLAELFARLLRDGSPYVRENAAWAIGELGGDADGTVPGRATLALLRSMRARDPNDKVRSAARGALERLQ